MKKLLLVNFVNGRYKEYIPLFLYFANRSYPEYDNLVLVQGSLLKETRELLWDIIQKAPHGLAEKFANNQIKENMFARFREDAGTIMTLRWLYFDHLYYKYPYIFIGDIDILLLREDPMLMEKHLKTMELFKLRHSNTSGIDGGTRVTGLHFMSSVGMANMKPFMDKEIQEFAKRTPEYFINPDRGVFDNQYVLKYMLEQSGHGVPMHSRFFYHGMHLGHSRVDGRWQQLVDAGPKEEADYQKLYEKFLEIEKEDIYKLIYDRMPDRIKSEINEMKAVMDGKYIHS